MWLEIGTLMLSTMLSFTGFGMPQLNIDVVNATNTAPVVLCGAQTADGCLDADACDVFVAASGEEICGVACGMRDLNSCQADGRCMVVNGACDYTDHSPVGC